MPNGTYYEILTLRNDRDYIEKITGISFWKLQAETLGRLADGLMKKESDKYHYICRTYNRILKEKGINVRVI